jgi:hypothetical protein
MKGFLTENQIEYVLFHLEAHIELPAEIKNCFIFMRGNKKMSSTPTINFKLSNLPYNKEDVILIGGIPILFPLSSQDDLYTLSGKSIVFNHDILKSCFYLLSGYQELNPEKLDSMNRFAYESSVQHDLDIAKIPVVSYYFEMIISAVRKFCSINGIEISPRKTFKNFALVLSHDVDIIDAYSIYETIYKLKQAFGMAPRQLSRGKTIKLALKYLFNYINIFSAKNPAWSFPFIMEIEKKHKFRSSYYFLPKEKLHDDAYYKFSEKRIRDLFKDLDDNNCEIGLHGTVNSSLQESSLRSSIDALKLESPQTIDGIRQHRLMYEISTTPKLQEKAGFQYDTSLGFAEQEGFRNSYCHPFRLYDHTEDRMMDLWELPLTVMDITLFHYRGLDFKQAKSKISDLIHETKKFNGVFSLLWHNNFFDEDLHPGIRDFYKEIHEDIASLSPESLTAREIISRMKNN